MDITGPHDSAAEDDTWWRMVARLPGAAERLEKMVEYSCRILARTLPIHAIIRGAADKEPFAAELGRRLLTERLANQTERIRRYLGDALRPGLAVAEAGERYCALASPELYHLLTIELAWTAEQHRGWLTQLLHTELLGITGRRPRPTHTAPAEPSPAMTSWSLPFSAAAGGCGGRTPGPGGGPRRRTRPRPRCGSPAPRGRAAPAPSRRRGGP